MSYRPTISIYLNGGLAEIYLLFNTDPARLREFALALAVYLDGCSSPEQVRDMLGMPPAAESFLKEMEASSEDPFVVDLTSRCVYCNFGPMSRADLERTRVLDLGRTPALFEGGQFGIPPLYIPFEAIPVAEIRGSGAYVHMRNRGRPRP